MTVLGCVQGKNRRSRSGSLEDLDEDLLAEEVASQVAAQPQPMQAVVQATAASQLAQATC